MSLSSQAEFEESLLAFYNDVNACALEPIKWSWETSSFSMLRQSFLKKTDLLLLEAEPSNTEVDEAVEEVEDLACAYSSPTRQAIRLEHHIVYSTSYQAPVLYFRALYQDGTLLSQREIYQHIVPESQQDIVLSQSDHPILGTPYWYIHPCNTRIAMSTIPFTRQDYIKKWLSIFGPLVQCKVSFALFLE